MSVISGMASGGDDKSPNQPPTPLTGLAKNRITYACEACRAAKVRCQTSKQAGLCRRCIDSKRECVFKTGHRTRRPRQSKHNTAERQSVPPPPGPSKTFTIDVPLPHEDDAADNLDKIRETHEMFFDNLGLAVDDDLIPSNLAIGSTLREGDVTAAQSPTTRSTPLSTVSGPTPCSYAHQPIQPQFNLDSAESLLRFFRDDMLAHFPCIVLPPSPSAGTSAVASLASGRPFLLLAILAAASGSRTLQGHSLYDDEFRRVLGLKFVAGGERSLELLQSVLVYCAWYPYHLRPRNRQAQQYVRMVVDIVRDLELDQAPTDAAGVLFSVTDEPLQGIRALLASYFLVSSNEVTWSGNESLEFTTWMGTCCERLGNESTRPGDLVLAELVRQQRLLAEIAKLGRARHPEPRSDYQIGLILSGMDTQLREWRSILPPDVVETPVFIISNLFTELFLYGSALIGPKGSFPGSGRGSRRPNAGSKSSIQHDDHSTRLNPERLTIATSLVRRIFEYILSLGPTGLAGFSSVTWARIVVTIILAFRMSFPLPGCPGWDAARARSLMCFGEFLDRMSATAEEKGGRETAAASAPSKEQGRDRNQQHREQARPVDVLSAMAVVLDVLKKKYDKRVALTGERRQREEHPQPQPQQQQPEQQCAHDTPIADCGCGTAVENDAGGRAGGPDWTGGEEFVLDKSVMGCPMMDGSLTQYFALWDSPLGGLGGPVMPGVGGAEVPAAELPSSGPSSSATDGSNNMPPNVYHDLWATMTMGWADCGLSMKILEMNKAL